MKSFFKVAIAFIIITTSFSMLTSCSDPDPVPTDVITDETGIKIDLDWTTGGSINTALNEADLDLYIYKDEVRVGSSLSDDSFERVNMYADDFEDGTYKVGVYLYENSKNTSYTVTVNGQATSKPVTFTSTFTAEDDNREVIGLTITKSGSKYTVKEN